MIAKRWQCAWNRLSFGANQNTRPGLVFLAATMGVLVAHQSAMACFQNPNSSLRNQSFTSISNESQQDDPKVVAAEKAAIRAAVEALIKASNDREPNVRSAAIRLLGSATQEHELILKRLSKAFADPDDSVAQAAQQSFVQLSIDQDQKVRILLDMLSSDEKQKVELADGIIRQLVIDEPLLKRIGLALADPMIEQPVKKRLFAMLIDWGEAAAPIVESLIEIYEQDETWKREVLMVLGNFGAKGKKAIPLISKAINDEDQSIRLLAMNALGSIWVEQDPRLARANPSVAAYVDSVFKRFDRDQNGVLTEDEFNVAGGARLMTHDRNNDRVLSKVELVYGLGGARSSRTSRPSRTRAGGR